MRAQIKRKANAMVAAILAAIFAFSLSSLPTSALADDKNDITINGVDFMQPSSPTWEVLRVNGLGNQEIFITVKEGDTPLSNPVKYVPTDKHGNGDNIAQIVSVDIVKGDKKSAIELIDPNDPAKYSVEVRTVGYPGADPIKTLTIYPIYAQLQDLNGETIGEPNLIGIRTVDSDQETPANTNIGVAQTYYTQNSGQATPASYSLVKPGGGYTDNVFKDNAFYVTYKQNDASSVTGTINYVCNNVVVKTETVTGVNSKTPVTAQILKTFSVRNSENNTIKNYRVISNLGGTKVDFSTNPEHFCTSYTVQVAELAGDEDPLHVKIEYVADSQNNKALWTDNVDVRGDGYFYTVPNTFSMKNANGVQFYRLSSVYIDGNKIEDKGIANPADAGSVLALVPAENATGEQTIKAVYTTNMFEAEMTLEIIDGSTGNKLLTKKFPITKDEAVDYKLENIEKDGKTYVPWEGNLENVTYSWEDLSGEWINGTYVPGKDLLQRVYYVPEGWTPGDTKSVTVQCKNIANGQVLRSNVYELTPENNYLTVVGDERFNYGGTEFVRLPGQESGIRHAYFSPNETYTIWYRDVNDSQNANTTISNFQNPNGDTAGGIEAVGGETPGITGGDGTIIINDDDNPLANLDGVDTTTERTIEDNENPLFSGNGLLQNGFAVAGLSIGALALIGLIVYFLLRRRSKANDKQEA